MNALCLLVDIIILVILINIFSCRVPEHNVCLTGSLRQLLRKLLQNVTEVVLTHLRLFGRSHALDRGKSLVLRSLEHLLYIPLVILLILVEYALFFGCDRVARRLVQQLPFILTRHHVALPLSVENISGLRGRPTPVWSVHFMLKQLVLEQLGLTDLLILIGFKCTSRLILLTVRKGEHLLNIARGPSCCPTIPVLPVRNSCIGIVTVGEAHLWTDGTRAF